MSGVTLPLHRTVYREEGAPRLRRQNNFPKKDGCFGLFERRFLLSLGCDPRILFLTGHSVAVPRRIV